MPKNPKHLVEVEATVVVRIAVRAPTEQSALTAAVKCFKDEIRNPTFLKGLKYKRPNATQYLDTVPTRGSWKNY